MTDIEQLQSYLSGQEDMLVVYLFGSRTEGRAAPQSDYDIAVLARAKLTPARRFELASELRRVLRGQPVDLVVLNDVPVE